MHRMSDFSKIKKVQVVKILPGNIKNQYLKSAYQTETSETSDLEVIDIIDSAD